jgi:hypothetical protein
MPEEEQVVPHKNPVEIRNPQGDVLIVDPRGGRIIELTLGGVPILTSITRGDGSKANTHLCTPIFGPDKDDLYGLNQHGDMRNNFCEVAKTEDGEGITVSYKILDADGKYPSGVIVKERLTIKDGKLEWTITHENTGEQEAPVNLGLHCYFAAPNGHVGTRVNGKDVTSLIEGNRVVSLEETSVLEIPGVSKKLILAQQRFRFANYWVGRYTDGQPDPNGKPDAGYLCMEPVENDPNEPFNSPENMILPCGSRTATLIISVDKPTA